MSVKETHPRHAHPLSQMPPLCHLLRSDLNGMELRTPPAAVFKIGFALDVQNKESGDDGSWGLEQGAERWGWWGCHTGRSVGFGDWGDIAGRVDIG